MSAHAIDLAEDVFWSWRFDQSFQKEWRAYERANAKANKAYTEEMWLVMTIHWQWPA